MTYLKDPKPDIPAPSEEEKLLDETCLESRKEVYALMLAKSFCADYEISLYGASSGLEGKSEAEIQGWKAVGLYVANEQDTAQEVLEELPHSSRLQLPTSRKLEDVAIEGTRYGIDLYNVYAMAAIGVFPAFKCLPERERAAWIARGIAVVNLIDRIYEQ